MTRDTLDRRTMLKTMAVGATSVGLAGCSGGGSSSDSSGDDSGGSGGGTKSFGGWFDDVSNYDGVTDETSSSEVTVTVGAKGNDANYAYSPAAIKVSSGTKVVWKWNGKGGNHNVVAEGGEFESETVGEKGHTFSHTFDSSGTYKYYCTPHKALGMKGVVVVE